MNQAEHTEPLAAQLQAVITQMIEQAAAERVNAIITQMVEQAVEKKVAERLQALDQQTAQALAVCKPPQTRAPTDEDAVQLVRDFLEKHKPHFQHPAPSLVRIPQRIGFIKLDDSSEVEEFLILPEAFRQKVCEGYDPRLVAKALHRAGYLLLAPSSPRGFKTQRRLPGFGGNAVGVYALRPEILARQPRQPGAKEG